MNEYIKNLHWRYATKKFDETKKIPKEILDEIIETFRLTPSSFGLEPWRLVVIEDEALKQQLTEASFGQEQVAKNSHLLVFCRVKTIETNYIQDFIDKTSSKIGKTPEELAGLQAMVQGRFDSFDEQGQALWGSNQVYLALGFVMDYLAQHHIDSCAIGGFIPEKYDELLDLEKDGLTSVVVLPIGYRHPDDTYIQKPKVRFETEEIVRFK